MWSPYKLFNSDVRSVGWQKQESDLERTNIWRKEASWISMEDWSTQRGWSRTEGMRGTLPCMVQKSPSHPHSFPVSNRAHEALCILTIPHFIWAGLCECPSLLPKVPDYNRNKHTNYWNDFSQVSPGFANDDQERLEKNHIHLGVSQDSWT